MEHQLTKIICGITVLFLSTIELVHCGQESSGSTLNLPCKPYRVEISFPSIDDATGSVTSQIFRESYPRSILHVKMKWHRRPMEVILYKNDLTGGASISEWEDGNTTYAKTIGKTCFYHGYIKGQRKSYVALTTCGGLSGYMQTDDEMLFIQPRNTGEFRGNSTQAHLTYTCEPPSRETRFPKRQSSAKWMRRRRRRSASQPKYLEVQVVVDHTMVKAIGTKQKTEDYVMTLMNIQRDVMRKRDAFRTVNMFCQWSWDHVPKGQPMDYDVSVLITKDELGPSGYAPITGLCNPLRSCAAVHDEGFTTGFVVAHEMAHVFGLFHDGHGNNCYGKRYKTAIMAPIVEAKLNHYWWSECSKRRMHEILRFLYCLNNKPRIASDHYPLDAPQRLHSEMGDPWSLNFQCKMDFGEYFSLCYAFHNDPCGVLWCSRKNNPTYCRTKRGPPLPGSKCGRDMECQNEQCQYVGSRTPVNGKWSDWSDWGECSNGCGVGVRQKTRACNKPAPLFGGKECEGEQYIWDTCYNNTCANFQDLRAGECSVWDSMQIKHGTHKWLPIEPINVTTQCKQTCKSFYTGEVVTIGVDVADGTPCSYLKDTSDVCMAGKCLQVGCDGKMKSTKKRDACGRCGGDGSECKVVQGTFKIRPKSANKYVKVLTLPSGARNISIIQLNKTFQFLALNDVVYGKFRLNGNKRQSKGGQMIIKGTLFYYTVGNSTHMESLKTPGPLMAKLDVMVLPNTRLQNISISYSYTVHKSDFTLEKNKYKWKFERWSSCSVTCSVGFQTIVYGCQDKDNGKMVEKEKCSFLKAPRKDNVRCTRAKCSLLRYNYAMTNDFSECTAKCGQIGTQKQLFRCERVHDQQYEIVDMKLCSHLQEPYVIRKCKGEPCQNEEGITYQWTASEQWSKCQSMKECGGPGHRTRQVQCVTIRGERKSSKETVDDSKCRTEAKPESTQTCQAEPCPDQYQWTVKGKWSNCPCGKEKGIQSREVVCEKLQDGNGKMIVSLTEPKHCQNVADKPNTERSCKGGPCPPGFRWKIEPGPCDAECGESGIQKVKVACEQVVVWKGREILEVVRESFCNKSKPKGKPCQGDPCKPIYKWKATDEWTECTAKCDETATQFRMFICEKSVKDNSFSHVEDQLCSHISKKNITKECTGPLCPLKWKIGEWSECSVTCGRGKRYRKIHCGDPETDMDDFRCTYTPPITSRRCDLTWCPMPKKSECKNMFSFCSSYSNLKSRCKKASFEKRCCSTCQKYVQGTFIEPPKNALEEYMKKRGLGRWSKKGRR